MRNGAVAIALAATTLLSAAALAQTTQPIEPLRLSLAPDQVESVYAPPDAPMEDQGSNTGPVKLDLTVAGLTDYVYRGIDYSETGGSEDSPNLQFDASMRFDLGRYPDLFMGIFSNVYDSDPLSKIQEVRPYFGLELSARPLTFTVGNTFYIYPERDDSNNAEVWVKMTLDDSYFFRSDDPIFSPYALVAYSYDGNTGFYIELGVRHDFELDELPLTISPIARIAYVNNNPYYRADGADPTDPFVGGTSGPDSGLQHYDLGLELSYTLNGLMKIPQRYGKLDLQGVLFYTDGIDDELRADSVLYGGVGIKFSY